MSDVKQVAVLFARADSIYKTMPECDVYDIGRDARTWQGGMPIVAHPPCRAWGGLAHFAKPRPGERKLAIWSIVQLRRWGGVLEHPAASRLWPVMQLPAPGQSDKFGGWTMVIDQDWFGHRAQKRTRLYIVGCSPRDIPAYPLRIEEPSHTVSPSHNIRVGHPLYRPQLRKPEREATPPELAKWLVELASRCSLLRFVA
jgi:hypothetical protein